MEKNHGIVLKSYQPYKCKLSILDTRLGKIVAVPNRETISSGSYISYYVTEQPKLFFIYDVEIIDMPLALAKDDILFIHHLLEICYYFIPMNNTQQRIIELLIHLYAAKHIFENATLKKLFLFQFFTTLGFYPEGKRFQNPLFIRLASLSIDNLMGQHVDLIIETELDNWLLNCISTHPCIKNFKTINFLHNNRTV